MRLYRGSQAAARAWWTNDETVEENCWYALIYNRLSWDRLVLESIVSFFVFADPGAVSPEAPRTSVGALEAHLLHHTVALDPM